MNKKQEIILNKDIINQCLDYLVGSKEYHKKNYDKVIRNMEIIFRYYEGNISSCIDELLRIINDEEEISNLYSFIYKSNNFRVYLPFFKKYFNKPWKYILEVQKRNTLSLWS